MISFAELHAMLQVLILVLMLIILLINGHIAASTIFRGRRWKISLMAISHLLLYYIILVSLSTFLYEIELKVKPHPISRYFASLPLWIYTITFLIGTGFVFIFLYREGAYQQNIITRASIKESIDNLSAGLCISLENSFVILSNWQIERLCHILTGRDLRNGEDFWGILTEAELKSGNQRWVQTSNPIITFADGRTWSFKRNVIEMRGQSVIEITAIDITDLSALKVRSEENNKILAEMGDRLRRYSASIMEIKAKEERLATKMRIHDEFGYALLATSQFFRKQKSGTEIESEVGEILGIWKKNISVLQGATESKKPTALDTLNSAARSIGIHIDLNGTLPKDAFVTNLILLVAGECLTNSVRHAHATKLYLEINETPKSYIATFSNNGAIPIAGIIEGGGLSGLRQKIEAIGGVMEVTHIPKFYLKATIPKEIKEYQVIENVF